jgi:hypothetical protein
MRRNSKTPDTFLLKGQLRKRRRFNEELKRIAQREREAADALVIKKSLTSALQRRKDTEK